MPAAIGGGAVSAERHGSDAIRLLKILEWSGTSFFGEERLAHGDCHPGYDACPECLGLKEQPWVARSELGHRPKCELARIIRFAGSPPPVADEGSAKV